MQNQQQTEKNKKKRNTFSIIYKNLQYKNIGKLDKKKSQSTHAKKGMGGRLPKQAQNNAVANLGIHKGFHATAKHIKRLKAFNVYSNKKSDFKTKIMLSLIQESTRDSMRQQSTLNA